MAAEFAPAKKTADKSKVSAPDAAGDNKDTPAVKTTISGTPGNTPEIVRELPLITLGRGPTLHQGSSPLKPEEFIPPPGSVRIPWPTVPRPEAAEGSTDRTAMAAEARKLLSETYRDERLRKLFDSLNDEQALEFAKRVKPPTIEKGTIPTKSSTPESAEPIKAAPVPGPAVPPVVPAPGSKPGKVETVK